MIVNGTDLTTIGFKETDPPDHWSTAIQTQVSATIPSRPGSIVAGITPVVAQRRVVVNGLIERTTAALLRDARDELIWRMHSPGTALTYFNDQGATQVIMPDMDPGGGAERHFLVHTASVRTRLPNPAFIGAGSTLAFLTIEMNLLYPFALSTAVTNATGIGTTYVDADQGTAPSLGVFTITGAATTPILRYRNHATTLLESMTFATLGGSEVYTIDMSAGTVVGSGGAPADSMTEITAGDFFAMDPNDGDGVYPITTNPPEISVSAGTATMNYYKAWR